MEADGFEQSGASRSVRLVMRGEDHRTVDKAAADVVTAAIATGCRVTGPLPEPSEETASGRRHVRLVVVHQPGAATLGAFQRLTLTGGVETRIVMPEEKPSDAQPQGKRNRRHDSRVAAVRFLLSWETQRHPDLVTGLHDFFALQADPREEYAFAEELIHGVIREADAVDAVIARLASNWSFERIARVDLAVLRVGVHELMRREDIPPVVSINEAVDIAKEFSTEESRRFVNGILDRYKGEIGRDPRSAG
ncbi:MAG: transcription antitermination factor NusB [Verrucomicrobiota bacterium]